MTDVRLAVVIMSMRVGSTWFTTTYLAQHPQVHLVSGEMCHGVPPDSCNVERFDKALDECRRAREKKPAVTTCVYKAPAWFWGSNLSADAFADNAHYFAERNALIIHLYRRNMLKQAVSLSDSARGGSDSRTWGVGASRGPPPAQPCRRPLRRECTNSAPSRCCTPLCTFSRAGTALADSLSTCFPAPGHRQPWRSRTRICPACSDVAQRLAASTIFWA